MKSKTALPFLGIFIFVLSGPLGCSHGGMKVKEVRVRQPVLLQINGNKGQVELTRYRYLSTKATTDERKIRVKRDESVDFVTKSEVIDSLKDNQVRVRVQTTQKEGGVELNDLSFPELNESIDFIFTPSAKVLKAGGYSRESIFFVQPIPLPEGPVSKGDTWTLEHTWLSRHNSLPLKIELVSILSRFVECGENDRCADIEISGRVVLPPGMIKGSLQSQVFGRLLFAEKKGMIVWSDIRTEERLKTEDEKIEIDSCLESLVEEPKSYRWAFKEKADCDPKVEFTGRIPGD
jgi:hypothetical protein